MTVTKLDNIMVSSTRKESPYYKFYGKHPTFVDSLRTFGEIGIMSNHEDKKIRSKLAPRGKACMFVGYPESSSPDTYQMLNLETN